MQKNFFQRESALAVSGGFRLAAVVLAFASLQDSKAAATVWNGSVSNDYNTAANWNAGGSFPVEVPGTTDTASSPRLNGGATTNLNSAVPNVQQVYLGLSGSGDVNFNVGSGADLTSNNGFFVGWAGSVGTVNYSQSGGSVTTTGGNEFSVARGSGATTATTANASVSGGSLSTQTLHVAAKFSNGSVGTMQVSGGTVDSTSLFVGNGTSVGSLTVSGTGSFSISGNADFGTGANLTNNANLTLDGSAATFTVTGDMFIRGRVETAFVMDALGLATVEVDNNLFIGTNNTGLTIDGTAFSGAGTFDVYTFGTTSGSSTFVNETLIGFAPGTASLVYNSNSIQLVVIPEPSVFTLLSLLGGAFLLRRRR